MFLTLVLNNNCNRGNPLFFTSTLQNLTILVFFFKFNIEVLLPLISRSARIMQLTCRSNVIFCFGRLSDVSAVKIQIYLPYASKTDETFPFASD